MSLKARGQVSTSRVAGCLRQRPGVGRASQRAEDGVAVGGRKGEEEREEHKLFGD